jgi:hypothetical protein
VVAGADEAAGVGWAGGVVAVDARAAGLAPAAPDGRSAAESSADARRIANENGGHLGICNRS